MSIVTDDELTALTTKMHELFVRVQQGSLRFENVLTGLQEMIHGRENKPTKTHYCVWKTVKIGGIKSDEFRVRLGKRKKLRDQARDIMKHKAFTTLDAEEEADLIVLTPKDFGYTEKPQTDDFLDSTRLYEWSMNNLRGYVLELSPPEIGPHLVEQYKGQPNNEILWIAMERITNFNGDPSVFSVRNFVEGRYLDAEQLDSYDTVDLDCGFVFRLRRVAVA